MRPVNAWPASTPTLVALLSAAALSCSAPEVTEPPPAANEIPVAAAGPDLSVSVGLPVRLDGTASTDGDGDALGFQWTLTAPVGSTAAFDDAGSTQPSFTPDLPGTYTARLVVSDGASDSPADAATITAADNTRGATIGFAGGDVTSADGIATLSLPSGAVSSDTEIRVTLVPPAQRPPRLSVLSDEALVYDFQPDGLVLASPATLTLTIEDGLSSEGETLSVPLALVGVMSGDEVSAVDHIVDVNRGEAAITMRAEVAHFSFLFAEVVGVDGPAANVTFVVPDVVRVGIPFDVRITAVTSSAATLFLEVFQIDESGPGVEAEPTFDGAFDVADDGRGAQSSNSFSCSPAGLGYFGALVQVIFTTESSESLGMAPIRAEQRLGAEVECVEDEGGPEAAFVAVTGPNEWTDFTVDKSSGVISTGESTGVPEPIDFLAPSADGAFYGLGSGSGPEESPTLTKFSRDGVPMFTTRVPLTGRPGDYRAHYLVSGGLYVMSATPTGVQVHRDDGDSFSELESPFDDRLVNQALTWTPVALGAGNFLTGVLSGHGLLELFAMAAGTGAFVALDGSPLQLPLESVMGVVAVEVTQTRTCLYPNDFGGDFSVVRVTPEGATLIAGGPQSLGGAGVLVRGRLGVMKGDAAGTDIEIDVVDEDCGLTPEQTVRLAVVNARAVFHDDVLVVWGQREFGSAEWVAQAALLNPDDTWTVGAVFPMPWPLPVTAIVGFPW